ncbi:MAG: hypothetical protein NZL94_03060 [Meiothermus sp.]|uniref:hypothetical protein n=1 Tax=Meiothermus sp. TaxID=1955249 RepID=UPI0025D2F3E7|nr:hypothetical protein [Meiothermus sp.]MCS7057847.1 hypothetical protein [Meiothermus sp.]
MGRKYLLSAALAGLALGLSGCLVLVESPAVSNFRFDSNWQRQDTGAYVFCSNRETLMRYRFRAPDSSLIQRIEERYVGLASGKDYTEDRPLRDLSRDGSDLVFVGQLTFGEGGIPQGQPGELGPQSIVVTPITPPPSSTGRTRVTVTVTTISGRNYSGSYTYEVYSNCP